MRVFTFVEDVVAANLAAVSADGEPGTDSSGESSSMNEVIDVVGLILGAPIDVVRKPTVSGDVRQTRGDISSDRRNLSWSPTTPLQSGIGQQVLWHREVAARQRPGDGR